MKVVLLEDDDEEVQWTERVKSSNEHGGVLERQAPHKPRALACAGTGLFGLRRVAL